MECGVPVPGQVLSVRASGVDGRQQWACVHNHGVSVADMNAAMMVVRREAQAATDSPLRSVLWLAGDFNADAPGRVSRRRCISSGVRGRERRGGACRPRWRRCCA